MARTKTGTYSLAAMSVAIVPLVWAGMIAGVRVWLHLRRSSHRLSVYQSLWKLTELPSKSLVMLNGFPRFLACRSLVLVGVFLLSVGSFLLLLWFF